MSIQNHYLTLYCPNHTQPIALLEYQQSKGNKKRRNLKWLKDKLYLSKSKNIATDIQYLNAYGYVTKVSDLASLPRNTHRNITPEFIPSLIPTEDLTKWFQVYG